MLSRIMLVVGCFFVFMNFTLGSVLYIYGEDSLSKEVSFFIFAQAIWLIVMLIK